MNWGKGIALLFGSFVVFMSTLVYMSVREDFYLVTDNYYTDGIDYDKTQNKIENVKLLKGEIEITQSTDQIEINIPSEIKKGVVKFYRPSNGKLDFSTSIDKNKVIINKKELAKGNWVLKIDWTDENKAYYFEESLFVL